MSEENPEPSVTPEEIAEWMKGLIHNTAFLLQRQVAFKIRNLFGEEFVYKNKNNNWAIAPEILDAFRKLTENELVWSRSRQGWRRRRESDPEGRMIR